MKEQHPEIDLQPNTLTFRVSNEDIINSRNQYGNLQYIIDIPSNTWNHTITDITDPDQPWLSEIKLDTGGLVLDDDVENEITITVPPNPVLDQQTGLWEINNLDINNFVTYNEWSEPYATNINIDLSQYKNYTIIDQSNQWRPITQTNVQLRLSDLFINYNPNSNQLFTPNNTLTIQVPTMTIQDYYLSKFKIDSDNLSTFNTTGNSEVTVNTNSSTNNNECYCIITIIDNTMNFYSVIVRDSYGSNNNLVFKIPPNSFYKLYSMSGSSTSANDFVKYFYYDNKMIGIISYYDNRYLYISGQTYPSESNINGGSGSIFGNFINDL